MVLAKYAELLVYGSDENGNIIATIKSSSKESMSQVIKTIEGLTTVEKVHLAYLNSDNDKTDNTKVM